ncbi:uncharacterized protein LOC143916704 [Arctopsyche grandis]|uniref:uncharacterized protein LOC143916704 n=1 Tax=Arctopsyche grandis TaxID=121162 RepID=UPI00406D8E88
MYKKNLENIIWHIGSSLRDVIQITYKMKSFKTLSLFILLAIVTFVHSATVIAKDESTKSDEQYTLFAVGPTSNPKAYTVEVYDPEKDLWSIFTKFERITNYDYSPFVFNGKLLIFGGETDAFVYSNEVVAYDLMKNTSTNLSPMGEKKTKVGISEIDGYIYVTGGQGNGPSIYDTVERYDPKTDSWAFMAPMLTKRYFHAVNVWEGKMYVAGGVFEGDKSTNSIEIYDPKSNTWTLGTPMQVNRYGFSIVFADASLFAFGGDWYNGVQGERFNFTTKKWSKIINPIDSTMWSEAIVFGENIILSANYDIYHEFNPKTNEVRELKSRTLKTSETLSFLLKKSLVNLAPQVEERNN